MAVDLSWFPMVLCFYEQLEAIMEMRELSRAEQSTSLSLPAQIKHKWASSCQTHILWTHSNMHMYSHMKHGHFIWKNG